MKKILFPYIKNTVGGSYVSSSIIVNSLLEKVNYNVKVALPNKGVNSHLFQSEIDYYGLSDKEVNNINNKITIFNLFIKIIIYMKIYKLSKNYLIKEKPNLVHINDDKTLLTWGLAAYRLKIPIIWHVREERKSKLDWFYRSISTKLILIAKSTQNRFKNINQQNIEIIYNGVDIDKFSPSIDLKKSKEKLGLEGEIITIGYIGNLSKMKRPEWFINAVADLIHEGYNIQSFIVGKDRTEGHYTKLFKSIISENNLEKKVKIVGYTSNPEDYFKGCDIFCLPSIHEPFGRVVIEAMASKTAVIATNAGGVPEIIDNNFNGILIDTNSYKEFKQGLLNLVKDQSLREKVSSNGLSTAKKHFSVENYTSEVLKVYKKTID